MEVYNKRYIQLYILKVQLQRCTYSKIKIIMYLFIVNFFREKEKRCKYEKIISLEC